MRHGARNGSTARRAIAGAFVVAGLLGCASASAQDGLFGFLQRFNQPQEEPSPAYEPRYEPLEMRVRPRRPAMRPTMRAMKPRSQDAVAARPRVHREARTRIGKTVRHDVIAAQREAYARLNPSTNPDWYLSDPTLRPGDIIVLRSGMAVFTGAPEAVHAAADFRPLADAPGLSPKERQALGRMAAVEAD